MGNLFADLENPHHLLPTPPFFGPIFTNQLTGYDVTKFIIVKGPIVAKGLSCSQSPKIIYIFLGGHNIFPYVLISYDNN